MLTPKIRRSKCAFYACSLTIGKRFPFVFVGTLIGSQYLLRFVIAKVNWNLDEFID